mgnify:CR=1 FL=1
MKSIVTGALFALASLPALAEDFTLAAGAGYKRPLAEAVAAFAAAGHGEVGQIYGNMGQVIGQARESGKIDIVCGDQKVLDKAEGLSITRFVPLGKGKLVVAWRKGLTLSAPESLADAAITRIGIPDEKSAIYGRAGRQYLDRAGLADSVADRLLTVATVPQVTAYLGSAEIDVGLMNLTDALGAGEKIGGWLLVDPGLYDPIIISCGMMDEKVAAGFAAFLETPEARAIMERHGL